MSESRTNVFVLGLDDFHRADFEAMPRADEFAFHGLLTLEEATRADLHPTDEMLDKARAQLDAFDGSVDAIVSHWDFPSSVMAPLLRRERGQPGPDPSAVMACEHKYWSRLEQARAAPDAVPAFEAVDPFSDRAAQVGLDFPFWIKPVIAHSSDLGFRIDGPEDLEHALGHIRDRIHRFGEPANALAAHVDVPDDVKKVDGYHCIAEAIISKGRQCTLEGFRANGELRVYGVVDTLRDRRVHSVLSRYQYPSSIPRRVQERMIGTTQAVLAHIGFDDAPFNVEFFWDEHEDTLRLLEINARISQSHCPLFALVDGASHQQVVIDLALGRTPDPPFRQGSHRIAGKFMMRVFESGVVAHAPSEGDAHLLSEAFPEQRFECHVHDGQALEDLPFQDSYSFNIADVYLGADSQHELLEKYERAKRMLPFEILRRPEIV